MQKTTTHANYNWQSPLYGILRDSNNQQEGSSRNIFWINLHLVPFFQKEQFAINKQTLPLQNQVLIFCVFRSKLVGSSGIFINCKFECFQNLNAPIGAFGKLCQIYEIFKTKRSDNVSTFPFTVNALTSAGKLKPLLIFQLNHFSSFKLESLLWWLKHKISTCTSPLVSP